MRNILVRALSGAVYVGVIVASIIWGGRWAYPLLCALLGAAGVIEFNRISLGTPLSFKHKFLLSMDVTGYIFGILGVTLGLISPGVAQQLFLIMLALAFLYIIARPVAQIYISVTDPIKTFTTSFGGNVYVGLPLLCSCLILSINPGILLALFVMIWCNDTGAFLSGITLGRHKLCERISPKKTWEGFFGGMLLCTLSAVACRQLFFGSLAFHSMVPMWNTVALGISVSIVATWGDLVESLLKRTAHIKDSGHIIPGHGGVLDRIDSLLLVMPWSLLWLALTNCI